MKKSILSALTLLMVLAVPVSASAESTPTDFEVRPASTYILPEYEDYQPESTGKTYEDVAKEFGVKSQVVTNDQISEAIVVNSPEEYEALLSSLKEGFEVNGEPQIDEKLQVASPSRFTTMGTNFIVPYEKVIHDFKVYWVKAFADASVADGKITGVNGYSKLYGYQFGLSYVGQNPSISIASDKTSFIATYRGEIQLYIFFEGVGRIDSFDIFGTISEKVVSNT
ncbi:hypothetical protein [Paenibacillus sp. O199]|uniref:hypothetical protein n=1 Tax=Paenibacillus sp. O199 TaxID=1643925 RepID=UPI0007BFA45E|nr:hypothetical protein [Paenibacillus sp. O199]